MVRYGQGVYQINVCRLFSFFERRPRQAKWEVAQRMFQRRYDEVFLRYERLINRKNERTSFYNGIFSRYRYPVLTAEHVPPFWKYDLNEKTNPLFEERLGVNAVFNAGALYMDDTFYLVARVEGADRKSFFAVAESKSGTQGFRFWDYPIYLPDPPGETSADDAETNVYDMRLTRHADGWIYGIFCSEKKDPDRPELEAAVASAGIARTKDLSHWERLPDLKTPSPQQRNVVLHPEFVDGKYAFYTRPQDGFIDAGNGGGICFGVCDDITNAQITQEQLVSPRRYHTITESKNGAGAPPIRTDRGWIHIAHGVRNTAAGLRYVLYAFATALDDPSHVIAAPSGYLLAPIGSERVGDVSNVVFCNGAVVDKNGRVYIYYASSDTRLHVATTSMERLTDYVFHTPSDALVTSECVRQRYELIRKNLAIMRKK